LIDVGCATVSEKQNPAEAGFCKKVKLTDKPRSFIESGVDSHSSLSTLSSHYAQIVKTPPKRGIVRR
jgi:hypothetical protein